MEKQQTFKHILGYLVGIFIFLILVPSLIYGISKIRFLQNHIFSNQFLRDVISAPLFIMGLCFVIWSNFDLFRIGKGGPTDGFNVSVSPQTKKLVVTGPYKYTRNPMVFGVHCIYFSWAIYLNTLLPLLFVIAFLFIAILYLKFSEEKRLIKDFGDNFRKYRESVSMIFPFPPKK